MTFVTLTVTGRDAVWMREGARSLALRTVDELANGRATEVERHNADWARIQAIRTQLDEANDRDDRARVEVHGDVELLRELIHRGAHEVAEPLSDAFAATCLSDRRLLAYRERTVGLLALLDLLIEDPTLRRSVQ